MRGLALCAVIIVPSRLSTNISIKKKAHATIEPIYSFENLQNLKGYFCHIRGFASHISNIINKRNGFIRCDGGGIAYRHDMQRFG